MVHQHFAALRRYVVALVAAVAMAAAAGGVAGADSVSNGVAYVVVADTIAGTNWNGLGTWRVDYQRVLGGDPEVIDGINTIIDGEARAQVAAADHSATNRKNWTFNATGTLFFGPITISELFVGEYDTDLPNMPYRSVATKVFDSRSGVLITWDNLFIEKQRGLNRLSEQTKAILPTVYPSPPSWNQAPFAAVDINFPAWLPTPEGIELHFADFQFGRGLPVISVPWAQVADLIAPEFRSIIG